MCRALRKYKTVKRFHEPDHAQEFTFTTYRRRQILLQNDHAHILARALDNACHKYDCDLVAFIFMPEHVHLLILPSTSEFAPSAFLHTLKRPASVRIKRSLATRDARLLTVHQKKGELSIPLALAGLPGHATPDVSA